MDTLAITQLVSISELQRDYLSLVERAKKMAGPLLLLKRSRPEAVLLSVATYQDLAEKSRLYEERLAMEAIEDFKKEKKAGRLLVAKKAEDFFK